MARVLDVFGVEVPIQLLFDFPSVEEMASVVKHHLSGGVETR